MKTLFVLSIIVPVGLLTTLRLTGFLSEPATIADTIESKPVIWKIERPNVLSHFINERNGLSYQNDKLSFFVDFWLGPYDPNWLGSGSPTIHIGIHNLEVFVQSGFIQSVQMTLSEDYPYSIIDFPLPPYGSYINLTLNKVIDCGNPHLLENNTKAFVGLVGVGKPFRVSVTGEAPLWKLNSPYNYTHRMEIITEVLFFDGPDNNNSFENAEEIGFGTHEAYIDGEADPVDYYRIWLEQGQRVQVGLDYPPEVTPQEMGVELYLYNTDKELRECILYRENTTRRITANIDLTGWWYIKTQFAVSPYIYILDVSLV